MLVVPDLVKAAVLAVASILLLVVLVAVARIYYRRNYSSIGKRKKAAKAEPYR